MGAKQSDEEKMAAVKALGDMRDVRAIPTLLEIYNTTKGEIAQAAMEALIRILPLTRSYNIATSKKRLGGDPTAGLVSLLFRTDNPVLATEACKALMAYGSDESILPLRRIVKVIKNETAHQACLDAIQAIEERCAKSQIKGSRVKSINPNASEEAAPRVNSQTRAHKSQTTFRKGKK